MQGTFSPWRMTEHAHFEGFRGPIALPIPDWNGPL